ncbi:MAG TPA: phosphatase PAP2 family protein [Gaiellaceae bacterium]|nr:phosphatase PAP2 family protein [Gaiellaceae bacterium]
MGGAVDRARVPARPAGEDRPAPRGIPRGGMRVDGGSPRLRYQDGDGSTTPEPRPAGGRPAPAYTVSSAMPSGHSASAFAGAVVLAFLVPRAAPYLIALASVMAFSRIYVGVHWPSDVVAGAALGTAVALAAILAVRRWSAALGGQAG